MLFASNTFRTTDGYTLFTRKFTPQSAPRAVLHIVHGMFEHSGRFQEVAEYLAKQGIVCRLYDQRGHGKSEGRRGDTSSYAHLVSDLERFYDLGYQEYPDLPHFLLGHSMGGCLVLNFTVRKKPPVTGVIASAPWLSLAFRPEAWKMHLGKIVAQLWPSFTQQTDMQLSALTRDPEQVEAYKHDTLMHTSISARFFLEATKAAHWVMKQAERFPVPLYLYHGTSDYVTSLETSREFAEKVPESLITFEELEGMYHDIFHDLGREAVYEKMLHWLETQMLVPQ